MTHKRLIAIVTLALALPHGASAKKHEKERGHDVDGAEVRVVFSPGEREVVLAWIGEAHGRGHCPPGLAKKRYAVGRRLAGGIVIAPLAPALELRIGAPPAGFRYGIIDGDVVKLAVGTLLVVDAIDGLLE